MKEKTIQYDRENRTTFSILSRPIEFPFGAPGNNMVLHYDSRFEEVYIKLNHNETQALIDELTKWINYKKKFNAFFNSLTESEQDEFYMSQKKLEGKGLDIYKAEDKIAQILNEKLTEAKEETN